jgi:uncharacterized protein (TIGR03067 family)
MSLLIALLCAAADDGVTVKALQGTWKGARFTEGKGDDASKGVKVELTFKDNALVGRKESNAPIGEATFTLSADGKSIDATGTSSGYRGKTYLGILKLENDTLTICIAGSGGKEAKRPTSFVAEPGPAHYLIVLKRQKP